MLFQGQPTIKVQQENSGSWSVWVEMELTCLDRDSTGLKESPRFVPVRSPPSRHELLLLTQSTRFILSSEEDALTLASGLSKAFENAEVEEGEDEWIVPDFDVCLP
jgi:hypothetical protein